MAIEKRTINGVEVDYDTEVGAAVGVVPEQPKPDTANSDTSKPDTPKPDAKQKGTAKTKNDGNT